MDEAKLVALLGRSLTSTEETNLELYLRVSKEQVETLLCISLDSNEGSGDIAATTRIFTPRPGMATIFTDIFHDLETVEVSETQVTATPYFWAKRTSDYYNSVVLATKTASEVSITAKWGFADLPDDLAMLWAQMFAVVSAKKTVQSVKSKRVEDFQITYGELSNTQELEKNNSTTIDKYGMCDIDIVRHGEVCLTHRIYNCGYCI